MAASTKIEDMEVGMFKKRSIGAVAGVLTLGVVAGVAVAQTTSPAELAFPAALADPATVERAEIRSGSDEPVLSGAFVAGTEAETGVERVAQLSGAPPATGTIEVEVSTENGQTTRELEITVDDLAPSAPYRLVIDGVDVATFTTDEDGDADLEYDSAPGA
jgi:hypothetical protein